MKSKNWKYILVFVFIFILLLVLFVGIKYYKSFEVKEDVREFIEQFGVMAPLALIALQLFQTIVPFMPGGIITLTGGYLFGVFLGTFYSLIGLVIGSFIVFTLSKKYGRPLFKKIANKKLYKNINSASKKYGAMFLFVTRIMPFFPHDIISYSVGTTSISRKDFILATIFGFLIHSFIHNYVGDSIYKGEFTIWFYLIIILFVLGAIVYLLKDKIIERLSKREKILNRNSLK